MDAATAEVITAGGHYHTHYHTEGYSNADIRHQLPSASVTKG